MKKFFIVLFIIIALAGTAFFFGWANFAVPPGSYGVISSKTHGTDSKLVQPGEFRWIWYKLIPTNVKISVFRLDRMQYPIDFNSSLPSGEIYASLLDDAKINFSYEIKGNISFSINPNELVKTASENNLTNQAELDKFTDDTAELIKVLLMYYINEMDSDDIELLLFGIPDASFYRSLELLFPIQDFLFVLNSAKYPDFALYRELRTFYEEYLKQQRENASFALGRILEVQVESRVRFAELEKYGELLTKYPILIDYLALEKQ